MRMLTRVFRVTLIRHGETMSNRESIMQGQLDTHLSDLGHEQARMIGKKLKDTAFSHAFSSDLRRASDTANAIMTANTVSTCQLTLDKRIRERGFGILEGKPHSEFHAAVQESGIPAAVYTPEGGETIPQVSQRAAAFFSEMCGTVAESLTASQDNGNSDVDNSVNLNGHVLIVSHGLLLRELKLVIAQRFSGDLDAEVKSELKKISPNTGRSQFVVQASKSDSDKLHIKCLSIDVLNDDSHLREDGNSLVTHFKGAL